MSQEDRHLYEFGPFRLDPFERQLTRSGNPIPLTPKAFDTLYALVENGGSLMEKDGLLQRVWPDTFVEEATLAQNIFTLRRALGGDREGDIYIETVPRRGYRFVAAVHVRALPLSETNRRGTTTEIASALEEPVAQSVAQAAVPTRSIASPQDLLDIPVEAELLHEKYSGPEDVAGHGPHAETIGSPKPRRIWNWALPAAALLFVAGLVMVFFQMRPVKALGRNDVIVLAELANTTGEPVFDGTLKEALAIDLAQTPFLNVLSDLKVARTLKLMQRAISDPITPNVAREICRRSNGRALLTGSIARLGSLYALQLKATDCHTGDLLAAVGAEAESQEKILRTLHEMSDVLRRKLGESLASIKRFDKPLDEATTSSLEALQAFSNGRWVRIQKGDAESIPFFKRAVELDPSFALAYDELGGRYRMVGQTKLAIANLRKAYDRRGLISERESYFISATYYISVTGELLRSAQQLQLLVQEYPNDSEAHRVLGYVCLQLGQYDRAVMESKQALQLEPDNNVSAANLIEAYFSLNRFDEAQDVLNNASSRTPDAPLIHFGLHLLAFLRNDEAAMQRQIAWARGKEFLEGAMLASEAEIQAYRGCIAKARQLALQAAVFSLRDGDAESAALSKGLLAFIEAESGNVAGAHKAANAAVALIRNNPMTTKTRQALAWAMYSHPAHSMLGEMAKEAPLDTLVQHYWLPVLRGQVELQNGHAGRAIEVLQEATPYELHFPGAMLAAYTRGKAYLKLRNGPAAIAEFQNIIQHSGLIGFEPTGALARLELARAWVLQAQSSSAQATATEKSRALAAYQDFLNLWKGADPDLPIVRQAKAEYARLQ